MPADWKRFARVYNDHKNFPTLADVAVELGLSYQTVRNKATILRAMNERGKGPKIKLRASTVRAITRNKGTPEEHAAARAQNLSLDIQVLVTKTRYPLVNPEAIVVESATVRRWDKSTRRYLPAESTPRTWLTDTLRVAPITRVKGRRFIFTGAQNDTEIHEPFWNNLQAYAKTIDAAIVVGPWTYETQWWSENNPTARAYDSRISDYLCFGQMRVGDNLFFCGEMNTLPTASHPISDLVTYSRGRWGIFPHAKRQLKSVPSTDPAIQAHQVMTTGAVTRPKIIPRKAGVKSIFHHVIGAVIVEFDQDGDFFCRHISGDAVTGAFYDLDAYVNNGKVTYGHRLRALVCADLHRAKLGPQNALGVFGLDIRTGKLVRCRNLIDRTRPERIFLHDLFDNETRNHHHQNDAAMNYELAFRGRDSVLREIREAADFLAQIHRNWMSIHVVESNHDLALERYVREGRYRMDGENMRLGLQLEDAYLAYREEVAKALDAFRPTPSFSLLEYAIRKVRPDLKHVSWIYDGKSFLVDGVECGHHGFRGANGAPGTVSGFAKIGKKMSIGDKHSPEINEGVYVAGTMELQHGYNKGPSGWAVSLIGQYPDGKRTLITGQKGKFFA